MHVLVLPSWYPIRERPHLGRYLHEQARALQQRGVRVGVVFPERRSLRLLTPAALARNRFQSRLYDEGGVPTLRRHGWNVWWRAPFRFAFRIADARSLASRYGRRHGRPDVIHAHSAQWAGAAGARLAMAWDCPLVLTEHFSGFARGIVTGTPHRLAREAFEAARVTLAVSGALRDTLVAQGYALPGTIGVLPNGVDTAFFAPPPHRPPGPFHLFALGDLHPVKGMDVLLQAFARAFPPGRAEQLTIGGDGPERARLERLARRLRVDDRVRFAGRLERRAVRAHLHRSHAFVLPSRQETFGVVLLEALATGVPVVATACGGPEDVVTPETGLLVPPGDAGPLGQALDTMSRRHPSFEESALRTYIESHFSLDAVAAHLADRYAAALR